MVNIEYGETALRLDLDPARLAGVLEPKPVRALDGVAPAARASLREPVGSPPLADLLKGKRRALILTVDNTRPSPTPLLQPILDLCEACGVAVRVAIAVGRHRQMTDDEIRLHLGHQICGRVPVVQHSAFDDPHERVGATNRGTDVLVNRIVLAPDVLIGAGIIEPSYLCGWSGGRKLVLPGMAHHTTIDANHFLLLQPGAVIGKLDGNPVSEDATEGSRMVPFHWITYSVVGADDQIAHVVSGDPYDAHTHACGLSREIFRTERIEADIVISSPGGRPYDWDLVQTKKAVVPATECVRRGGAIILAGECPDGLGAEAAFREWITTLRPHEVAEQVHDPARFSLGAHGANILARPIVERDAEVILVTSPDVARELAGSYVRAVTSIQEAMSLADARCGRDASVLLIRKARRLIV